MSSMIWSSGANEAVNFVAWGQTLAGRALGAHWGAALGVRCSLVGTVLSVQLCAVWPFSQRLLVLASSRLSCNCTLGPHAVCVVATFSPTRQLGRMSECDKIN